MRIRPAAGISAIVIALLVSGAFYSQLRDPRAQSRIYYVAADSVDWDYAPAGIDVMMGHPLDSTVFAVTNGPDSAFARVMRKAIYREYTDSSFTVLKPRPPEWEHLGILGPVFRGVVGDTIVVVFRNNTHFPASVHPHGVFYDKNSEGAIYEDGTVGNDKHDDGVPPGEVHRYVWPIPERAGPGPGDPSSIMWAYHSHHDERRDVYTGLIGALIVTARGQANPDGSPRGIDREFVSLFAAFDENTTHYEGANRFAYTGDTIASTARGPVLFFGFGYHTINGLMFGNLPVESMRMQEGDKVRWYLFSSTGFNDFHTPHWHGGTVLIGQKRTDVADLGGPLIMVTADLEADNPGVWMFHCHFAEPMVEGMGARFEIVARGAAPIAATPPATSTMAH
jgi:hephaestin